MTSFEQLLIELAELHEGTATRLRQFAKEVRRDHEEAHEVPFDVKIVARGRTIHPSIGTRQAEVLGLVARDHPAGVGTRKLSRAMAYDQANVYLTLAALATRGLVRKDAGTRPHRYFLSDRILEETAVGRLER